jgi:pteridine reductase
VTGGAARIGAAICRALAGQGVYVAIHYRRSSKEAGALARQLGALSCRVKADLNSERGCDELIETCVARAGRLDILVNNAAVFHKDSLRTITAQKLLVEFQTNLFAPMFLARAFASKVKKGKIVNLLDRRIAGLDASCVPYVLTKKALAELTRLAALELAPEITVNGVAPGPVLPPPGKGENYLRDHAGPVPLKRRITAGEIADAVIFLLKSDSITGQIVYVDGGQRLLGQGIFET